MENQQKISKLSIISFLFIVICASIFISLGLALNSDGVKSFDAAIISFVQGMISPAFTAFFKTVTFFGSVKGVVLLAILFSTMFIFLGKYMYTLYLLASVSLGAEVLNKFLKALFQRERPNLLRLVTEHGYSFPSGHAMGSVILFGGVTILLYKMYKMNRITMIWIMTACLFVILIGISRIYLGVHYPSDIIAGYSAGIIWLVVSIMIYRVFENKFDKQQVMNE